MVGIHKIFVIQYVFPFGLRFFFLATNFWMAIVNA